MLELPLRIMPEVVVTQPSTTRSADPWVVMVELLILMAEPAEAREVMLPPLMLIVVLLSVMPSPLVFMMALMFNMPPLVLMAALVRLIDPLTGDAP